MNTNGRKPVEVDRSLRNCCEKCEKCVKRLLPLILLAVYTLVGGFIFHLVEEPEEIRLRKEHSRNLTEARIEMRHKLADIILNYEGAEREEKFNEELLWYHQELGVSESDGEPDWNFWGSTFYAMTLYTTIGYGNVSPKTTAGRVLTIFYSLIGIPLALAAVVQLGIAVAYATIVVWRFCTSFGRKPKPTGHSKQQWQPVRTTTTQAAVEETEAQADIDLLSLPVSLLFFLTVIWTLATAGIFLIWEPWDYFTSLYFTIISFTTIGLGDVVPTNHRLMLLAVVFVLIGLGLLSTLFAVIQQQLEALRNSLKRNIDKLAQASLSSAPGNVDGNVQMSDGDNRAIDMELKQMVGQLPLSSRFLYWAMSDQSKANLVKYYRKKAGLICRSTQTDERWMRSSYLERIGEEEDRRSHDDVNSLVALCDFALR